MELNISNFVILNGLVVLGVILLLLRRKPQKPTRLNLKTSSSSDRILNVDGQNEGPTLSFENNQNGNGAGDEKDLNAIFMFNGHSFDAYEVLGLPAGASFEAAKSSFQKISKSGDEESKHLSELAFKTICKKEAKAYESV